MIKKKETYETHGFIFDSLDEAKDFESKHTFVWCDFDCCWQALSNSDLVKYREKFRENKDEFFNSAGKLANSNSMGSLYPLACVSYILNENNLSFHDVWGDE